MAREKITFWQVAFTHFVPCFFLGIVTLYFIQFAFIIDIFKNLANSGIDFFDMLIACINGLIVAGIVVGVHLLLSRRKCGDGRSHDKHEDSKRIRYAAVVGFLGGSLEMVFGFHDFGVIALTLLVLVILIWHLKMFAKDVVVILKPGSHATWHDVGELLRIYLNMLAGFTLINATLEVAHIFAGSTLPYSFGAQDGQLFLNSLYYTVVTMTTLGYGDIVPKTWDSKLMLIFQCLVSYVMFALMIGIVTRGVSSSATEPYDEATEKEV